MRRPVEDGHGLHLDLAWEPSKPGQLATTAELTSSSFAHLYVAALPPDSCHVADPEQGLLRPLHTHRGSCPICVCATGQAGQVCV